MDIATDGLYIGGSANPSPPPAMLADDPPQFQACALRSGPLGRLHRWTTPNSHHEHEVSDEAHFPRAISPTRQANSARFSLPDPVHQLSAGAQQQHRRQTLPASVHASSPASEVGGDQSCHLLRRKPVAMHRGSTAYERGQLSDASTLKACFCGQPEPMGPSTCVCSFRPTVQEAHVVRVRKQRVTTQMIRHLGPSGKVAAPQLSSRPPVLGEMLREETEPGEKQYPLVELTGPKEYTRTPDRTSSLTSSRTAADSAADGSLNGSDVYATDGDLESADVPGRTDRPPRGMVRWARVQLVSDMLLYVASLCFVLLAIWPAIEHVHFPHTTYTSRSGSANFGAFERTLHAQFRAYTFPILLVGCSILQLVKLTGKTWACLVQRHRRSKGRGWFAAKERNLSSDLLANGEQHGLHPFGRKQDHICTTPALAGPWEQYGMRVRCRAVFRMVRAGFVLIVLAAALIVTKSKVAYGQAVQREA